MQKNEQAEHICISVSEKLVHLSPLPSQFSIFRVHDELRKVNEKAYEPHIIAIGPYHHGKHHNVKRYIVAMQALEEETRRCYAEPVSLDSNEFVEMMLFYEAQTQPDGDVANKKEDRQFIPCATKLREDGIKFEKMQEGNFFDIKFKNGIMRISPLTIEDRTESFFWNLIAYKQYSDNNQFKFVTDYVKVMDCLINSPKDVELLCHHGIIDNWMGDAEVVSAIFNKITDSVTALPNNYFRYAGVFEKLVVAKAAYIKNTIVMSSSYASCIYASLCILNLAQSFLRFI
ncbi:hypothetical protein LguiA_029884 [Lonicera macranthoides]